ncbi:hypothetical protein VTK56DRAFT_5534 [Thermocarpiscus australiensis]
MMTTGWSADNAWKEVSHHLKAAERIINPQVYSGTGEHQRTPASSHYSLDNIYDASDEEERRARVQGSGTQPAPSRSGSSDRPVTPVAQAQQQQGGATRRSSQQSVAQQSQRSSGSKNTQPSAKSRGSTSTTTTKSSTSSKQPAGTLVGTASMSSAGARTKERGDVDRDSAGAIW